MINDPNRVLSALRNELVNVGLVRRPNDTYEPGRLPALHVEPKGGPPAPGERPTPETAGNVVVTIRLSSEVTGSIDDAYRRQYVIDFVYRSTGTQGLQAARSLHEAIRAHVVDGNAYQLGQVLDPAGPAQLSMLSANIYGGLGPLDDGADGPRTDLAKFVIEVLAV